MVVERYLLGWLPVLTSSSWCAALVCSAVQHPPPHASRTDLRRPALGVFRSGGRHRIEIRGEWLASHKEYIKTKHHHHTPTQNRTSPTSMRFQMLDGRADRGGEVNQSACAQCGGRQGQSIVEPNRALVCEKGLDKGVSGGRGATEVEGRGQGSLSEVP